MLVGVESTKLEEIHVLSDFAEIFPENILGLPSSCDINFTIKLTLGVTPISISFLQDGSIIDAKVKEAVHGTISEMFYSS